MGPKVFDDVVRTNAKPARHDEGRFEFFNRTASRYVASCRDLIEDWFSHVPAEHQPGLRGNLRSELHHRSAFWELYLHEAYRRSGYEVIIHPDLPGRSTHPDFLMGRDDGRFYLEAVTVGRNPAERAEEARLAQVHRLLAELLIEDFSIALETYAVGPRPLATKTLRARLRDWIAGLDANAVTRAVERSASAGFGALPEFCWNDDDWSLVFHAFPLGEWARGVPRSALGVMGPGEASMVDNVSGLTRVLDSKRGKYGTLDAALVSRFSPTPTSPLATTKLKMPCSASAHAARWRRPWGRDTSSKKVSGLAAKAGATARFLRCSRSMTSRRGACTTRGPAAGARWSLTSSCPRSPAGSPRW